MEGRLKDDFIIFHARAMGKAIEGMSLSCHDGILARYIKRHCARAFRGSYHSMEFVRSIYESKRCWLKMSTVLENSAMLKHKAIMSTEAFTSKYVLDIVRLTTDLVVPPGSIYRPGGCCPTFSACYERSKADGGAHTEVSINEDLAVGDYAKAEHVSRAQEQQCIEDTLYGGVENNVVFQSIPEPGKFRIITKGPASMYTGLRGLQRYLLNRWKAMPCSTMRDDVEDRLHWRMTGEGLINDGDLFISGDYSNATDAMNMDVTRAVLERILKNLGLAGTDLGEVARRSMEGANIHYPDGDVIRQVRGQLMGHPLSFPILCIINLSTYVRLTGRVNLLDIFRSRLFINGDDILFQGTEDMYQKWRCYAADVGLVVNEMKTYYNKRWGLINSILFNRDGRVVRYYNRALAIGHNVKSEPVRMVSQAATIWDDLGYEDELARKLARRHFLRTLQRKLPKITVGKKRFTPNYFISKQYGGLGLSTENPTSVTLDQRRVATYFARNPLQVALIEKLGMKPTSCELAISEFGKMKPTVESWLIDSRPVHGPLPELEDIDNIAESYLARALACKQWNINQHPVDDTHLIRFNIRRALRHREKPMSKRKCLESPCLRFRIVCSQLTPRIGCQPTLEEEVRYLGTLEPGYYERSKGLFEITPSGSLACSSS
jgi:hypothetical protein